MSVKQQIVRNKGANILLCLLVIFIYAYPIGAIKSSSDSSSCGVKIVESKDPIKRKETKPIPVDNKPKVSVPKKTLPTTGYNILIGIILICLVIVLTIIYQIIKHSRQKK